MPKTVKYIGTVTRWPELATTGKQSTWVPGQQEQRSDTEAAQLLATGLFSDVDATQLPEQKVVAISGVVSRDGTGAVRNAAFGWWVGPTVQADGDYTYVGFAADTGHGVGVACIHRPSGVIQRRIIDFLDHLAEPASPVANPSDDHDVTTVAVMRDGSVLCAYAAHAIEAKVYLARLTGGGNIDVAWRSSLTTSDVASYAQIVRVGSGLRANMLLLFYRLGNSAGGVWAVRTSVDDGRNWTAERTLIDAPYCNFSLQPNSTSRLNCYAYINPGTNGDHAPYFFILDTATTNGGIIVPGIGSPVANTEWLAGSANSALPLARTGGLKVVDIATHPASIRMSDAIRYDNNASSNSGSPTGASAGTSMMLGTEFTDGSESTTGNLYRYTYAGSGSLFTRRLVRNVGEPFFGSYYNGSCFDDETPDTVYVAYNLGSKTGTHYIDKMVTTDGGLTWAATNIVTSANRLARPRVGRDGFLYYTEFTDYDFWNSFQGSIKWVAI